MMLVEEFIPPTMMKSYAFSIAHLHSLETADTTRWQTHVIAGYASPWSPYSRRNACASHALSAPFQSSKYLHHTYTSILAPGRATCALFDRCAHACKPRREPYRSEVCFQAMLRPITSYLHLATPYLRLRNCGKTGAQPKMYASERREHWCGNSGPDARTAWGPQGE
jgi:hypothetical protein